MADKIKFPEISKQEWIDSILSSTRKEIFEFNLEIDPILSISPFISKTDISEYKISFSELCEGDWENLIEVQVSDPIESNKFLKELLEFDCNSIRLIVKKDFSQIDYSHLFDGIFLQMVELHLNSELIQSEGFQSFLSSLSTDERSDLKISINGSSESIFPIDINGMEYNLPSSDSIIEIGKEFLSCVYKYVLNNNAINGDSGQISLDFPVKMDTKFLKNISFLRALRLLAEHLFECFNLKPIKIRLYPFFEYNKAEFVFEDFLIKAGIGISSARIGGANGWFVRCANFSDLTIEENLQLFKLNHLIDFESKMPFVKDPMAGSFYIEKHSNEIAQKTWDVFVEEMNLI